MLPFLLFACLDKNPNDTASGTAQATVNMSINDLDNTLCQDVSGTPAAGASTYYYGSFANNNGSISGTEKVFLIANDTWDYGSCEITLNVTGSVVDPVNCSVCSQAFAITATMIDAESNCPEAYQQDYESYSTIYNIQDNGNGTNSWFFESGTLFASGTSNGALVEYLSDETCQWF